MGPGATLAGAERVGGLQKYRRTGWVGDGDVEANRAGPAKHNYDN